jgi:uncharacterized protein
MPVSNKSATNSGLKAFKYNNQYFAFEPISLKLFKISPTDFHNIEKRETELTEYCSTTSPSIDTTSPDTLGIAINTTHNCPFSCKYCFGSGYCNKSTASNTNMNFLTAKNTIDFFVNTCKELKIANLKITFLGGEPLLNLRLVKHIQEYIKNCSSEPLNFKQSIVTNALLLDTDAIDYLSANNFEVVISIDGEKTAHDKYRTFPDGKGTYDEIILNVNQAIKQCNNVACSTIAKGNNLYSAFKHAEKLGFQKFSPLIVSTNDPTISLSKTEMTTLLSDEQKIVKYLFEKMQKTEQYIKYVPIQKILSVLIYKNQQHHNACYAGYRFFAISVNGDIYPCPHFIENKNFTIGNVEEKFHLSNTAIYNQFKKIVVDNRQGCRTCWAKYVCGGGCYHDSLLYSGKVSNRGESCERFKNLLISILGELGSLPTI